jgi:tetratricopeptide (TPR) repeat protein
MEDQMRSRIIAFLTLVVIIGVTIPTMAISQESPSIGEVHFATTCDSEVGETFDRAVALLHSFEFALSRLSFEAVGQADPDCAMAQWGVAMTYYHLLWAPPTASELIAGHAAAEAAQQIPTSDREASYIEAISTFYRDYEKLDHRTRAMAYEHAMGSVQAGNPHDPEAAIFHQLAVLSNADPTDKTYTVQNETGPFFEAMFEKMPNHPGLPHYIIHSYDYPPLSSRAVDAAYRYLEIAPDLTHSVHMSGHIFTQEGMWEASIDANTLSVATAQALGGRQELLIQTQPEEMHSLDYLVYAYLQRGQNSEARRVVDHIANFENLNWTDAKVDFNGGAVAVRYAMERRAWDEAAALPEAPGDWVAGASYQARAAIALRHWARALGAARGGDPAAARQDLARVEHLAAEVSDHPNIWVRNTTEVLRLEAEAWIALAEGDNDRALQHMREAVEVEDQTDKSSLSPGRVLPAHEQLGDMLMELGHAEEAFREYAESLNHAARRFNSIYGMASSAQKWGRGDLAAHSYRQLLELTVPDSPREEVAEAKEFLAVGGE